MAQQAGDPVLPGVHDNDVQDHAVHPAQAYALIKSTPPIEGDPSVKGQYCLADWLIYMEEYCAIKRVEDILHKPEGHEYTPDETHMDNQVKYLLRNNLSPLNQESVKHMPHAADMWRHLTEVGLHFSCACLLCIIC